MVEWREVKESPIYKVSNDGRVMNTVTGNILKPQSVNGYSHVTLCDENGQHKRSIHRLVAKEFIPNPENKKQVNHIDGNRKNNNLDNLEWCTGSENMKHAYHTGLQKPIRSQIEYSLSRAAEKRKRPVRNIETGKSYPSILECANAEGLCHSAVSFHLAGKARKTRFEYITDFGGECGG